MNRMSYLQFLATIGVATLSLTLAAPSIAAPVSIDTSQIDDDSGDQKFAIGLTLSNTSRNYEGIGNQTARLPYFSANWRGLYVEGLNVGYKLSKGEKVSWDLIAVPRFLGYSETNSPVLTGLDDTDYSYHGGISANWETGIGRLNVQALTDLLNESSGSEIIATLSHAYQFGGLTLSPAVSVNWQDATLVDHYYGVTAAQATPDRAAYEGDSVFNTAVSLTAGYALTDSFQLIGQARADQYGSEIEDSPLVDENTTTSATIGLVYTF